MVDKPFPEGPYDLHTHTTASDGRLTPAQLVQEAKERGLAGLGVTDHDSVGGLDEALAAGKERGLLVIPGIELTADAAKSEVHLLGYWVDHHHPLLQQRLDEVRTARLDRARTMVHRLWTLGLKVSWEKVLEEAGPSRFVGRSHIFRAMVAQGLVPLAQKKEFFQHYLGQNGLAYVPHYYLPWQEAMHLILKTGGVPVLAHPGRMTEPLSILPTLVEEGLRGLEVYYPTHTPAEVASFRRVAASYHLIITGGTDYHGDSPEVQAPLGSCTAPPEAIAQLKAAAGVPVKS